MKPKTILIMPKTGPAFFTPPFGLMTLGARLEEAGFNVEILDTRIEKFGQVLSKIIKNRDEVISVNITSMTGPQIYHGLKISKYVKETFRLPVVWGGVHPSFLPEQTLKNPFIDIVCIGFGEYSLPEITDSLINGKKLDSVNGIAFKRNDKLIKTPARDPSEIQKFPTYAWHLINPSHYIIPEMVTKRTLSMFTSRGCPHNCTFCYGPAFHKRRWIGQAAEELLEEIDILRERANFSGIYFHDDNFAVDRKRVEEIVKGLKKRNIYYRFALKVEYITEEYLKFLKFHNCIGIDWGADSGSDFILSKYQKEATVDDTIKGVKLLSKYDMWGQVGIMIGHPEETMDDVNKSLDLMDYMAKINPKLKIGDVKIATPYPGSEFYNEALSHGFNPPDTLEKWSSYYWNKATMPWIKNKKLYETISYTSLVVFMSWRIKRKNGLFFNSLLKFFHFVEKYRWKKRFWRFAPEIRLMKLYMDLITFLLKLELIKK